MRRALGNATPEDGANARSAGRSGTGSRGMAAIEIPDTTETRVSGLSLKPSS